MAASASDIYGGFPRDSIHGQAFNSHFSNADDPYEPDPIQGFDVQIWVERYDPGTDPRTRMNPITKLILLGEFTELQLRIKSSSIKHPEVDSRTYLYFDDFFDLDYTLRKGLIDMNVLEHSFGLRYIHTLARFNRLPKMRITFNADPRSLDPMGRPRGELNQHVVIGGAGNQNSGQISQASALQSLNDRGLLSPADLEKSVLYANSNLSGSQHAADVLLNTINTKDPLGTVNRSNQQGTLSTAYRYPIGRWVLEGARCNELIMAATGVKVIQNEWHGSAEALRAYVFDEPDGHDGNFEPTYLYEKADGRKDFFHISGDLSQAADTRDPELERMIRDIEQAEKRKNLRNFLSDGISRFAGIPGTALVDAVGGAIDSAFSS